MTFYFFLPVSTRAESNLLINENKWIYLAFFSRKRKLLPTDSEPSPHHAVLWAVGIRHLSS